MSGDVSDTDCTNLLVLLWLPCYFRS